MLSSFLDDFAKRMEVAFDDRALADVLVYPMMLIFVSFMPSVIRSMKRQIDGCSEGGYTETLSITDRSYPIPLGGA